MDSTQIYQQVQAHYGSAAKGRSTAYSQTIAKAFGYTEEELSSTPKDANLGLSCGNPMTIAKLREGETVIDLGSGAGFDVFLAAKRVGPSGRVVGVDMNKDMLSRANRNKEKTNASNTEFVESVITNIDLPSGIADCIISNCVINLVPEAEKQLVFREMYRLLKSGGRIAVSDILAKKPLPDDLKRDMALYVGCVSGASQVAEYEEYLHESGFRDVLIVDSGNDLNAYHSTNEDGSKKAAKEACCAPDHLEKEAATDNAACCPTNLEGVSVEKRDCCAKGCCSTTAKETFTDGKSGCCSPSTPKNLEEGQTRLSQIDFNEWAGSYKIYAIKN